MKLISAWSNKVRRLILCGGGLVLVLTACCIFLRISRPSDVDAYIGMASECHPIWKQFAVRRFGMGDSAADLLRCYPPQIRQEFGPYAIYDYSKDSATALRVVAKDGKLITARAGSCTWEFFFFKTEDATADRMYADFLKEKHLNSERKRIGKLENMLGSFYSQQGRWPTNEDEFERFACSGTPRYSTNDLGITLIQHPDGSVEVASIELPDVRRSVTRPK